MSDIAINELNKYYGENHVLKGVSLEVYEGEKIALLGKNGAGKTTLFKVISGIETAESGNVSIASGKRVGVLDQIPQYPENYTVMDVLKTAFWRQYSLLEDMQALEKAMEKNPTEDLIKRYGRIQSEFESLGGYSMDSEIQRACMGLKIDEDMQMMSFEILSGGEKTRVNLASIILMETDILLLDEPTNHLDISSVEWLEEFLQQYEGSVIFISHDRYFIDNIAKRTIEIVDGKAVLYEGNYSYYIKEKEARYLQQLAQYNEEQKKVKQLEEAAKRMHEWAKNADNPAMHKRAFAIEKRIVRMDKTDKPIKEKLLSESFKENKFSGKDMVVLENLSKSYNDKTILNAINANVLKNDRIALVGANGCGKTTILRLITGEEIADSGKAKMGESVKFSLLEQNVAFENPEYTVLETIRHALIVNEETARRKLAAFHFKGKDIIKKVNSLSGGEKSRLKLCILMQTDTNLLILDEPTNHLDIQSREWIEEAVSSFNGTILFVSHDRYFINRFATRVWELSEGNLTNYKGSFSEFRQWKQSPNIDKAIKPREKSKAMKQVPKESQEKKSIRTIEKIEAEIYELEERLKVIGDEMQHNLTDYVALDRLNEEKSRLINIINVLYMEWEEFG